MANETKTTGTPPPDDGDAALEQTTGTPDGEGRDAESGEPTPEQYKALFLKQKSEVEEARRLKAEVEALRERIEQPPAAQDEPPDESDDGLLTEDERADLQDLARRGDRAAAATLKTDKALRTQREREAALTRNIADSFQLRDIEDRQERAEVYKHYQKNRHRFGDVKAARAEVREAKLASRVEQLEKELDAARRQPPRDVVTTHSREVPAKEAKTRSMTYEDFDRKQAQLKAEGRYREAMDMQRDLAAGKITPE